MKRFEHHGQRKISRKAHPDGADAGTAAFAMRKVRQRSQPLRHGAGFVRGQCAKLGAHAGAMKDRGALLRARNGAVAAEQRRHVDGEAGVADPAGKPRDMRADAGHLRHHDDGRPRAGHVDDLGDAIECDVEAPEILERIVLLHGPFRHRRNSLLVDGYPDRSRCAAAEDACSQGSPGDVFTDIIAISRPAS